MADVSKIDNFEGVFRAFEGSKRIKTDSKWILNTISAPQTAKKQRKTTFLVKKTLILRNSKKKTFFEKKYFLTPIITNMLFWSKMFPMYLASIPK